MAVIPVVPASGGIPNGSPHFSEYCGSSKHATNIEIYADTYLDCRMAKSVAKRRALGRRLPGIAGKDSAPWECFRGRYGNLTKAFRRPLPPGHVDCVGFRGTEFIRFAPRRRS